MSDEPTVGLNLLGKPFLCTVCDADRFRKETTLCKSSTRGPMGFGFTTKRATTLTCVNCGYVHWFFPQDAEGARNYESEQGVTAPDPSGAD